MKSRRQFITLLGGAALTWPVMARGQQVRPRPLVAFLAAGERRDFSRFYAGLIDGLRELGLVEGREFDIVYQYAEGNLQRLPSLAKELVQLNPEVIVASVTAAAVAAKNASEKVPIIAPQVIDPIGLGLVETYARPGRNVTGILASVDGLPGKQIEILREVAPSATRIGMLLNVNNAQNRQQAKDAQAALDARAIPLISIELHSPDDLDAAFAELASKNASGLLIPADPMFFVSRRRIAALAASARLPAMYSLREHVEDGGLISYAINRRDSFYRAASFVVKVIKGTPPADLPVELPRKLELVINLNTAKALLLKIPNTLLVSADEVIE